MRPTVKTVIHWSKAFGHMKNAGMAFVCLGRCKRLQDIYIRGKVDASGIHASTEALRESRRLDNIFDEDVKKQIDLKESHWVISYLNVRSLRCHQKDVEIDNAIMESDVFSFGETWLKPGEAIDFSGCNGFFANVGRGKRSGNISQIEFNPVHTWRFSCFRQIFCYTYENR